MSVSASVIIGNLIILNSAFMDYFSLILQLVKILYTQKVNKKHIFHRGY